MKILVAMEVLAVIVFIGVPSCKSRDLQRQTTEEANTTARVSGRECVLSDENRRLIEEETDRDLGLNRNALAVPIQSIIRSPCVRVCK